MKEKRTKPRVALIVLTGLCLTFVFSLYGYLHDSELPYPYSLSNFINRGDFQINPYTIFDDLDRGGKEIFKPIVNNPTESANPYANATFSWNQSDFLKVANALHQFVWNESLDGWGIYGMVFSRTCRDNPIGFDSGDITFFKNDNQRGSYLVHELDIYPSGGGVSWGGGGGWTRPLFGWKSINLYLLRITAGDALKIAEESGGKEFREKYRNECTIDLFLEPNGDDQEWLVYYDYHGSLDTFEIQINPFTGWHWGYR